MAGPTSGRSGGWEANESTLERLESHFMGARSHVILTDRPEVGPCPGHSH